jgi:hypothetical protein
VARRVDHLQAVLAEVDARAVVGDLDDVRFGDRVLLAHQREVLAHRFLAALDEAGRVDQVRRRHLVDVDREVRVRLDEVGGGAGVVGVDVRQHEVVEGRRLDAALAHPVHDGVGARRRASVDQRRFRVVEEVDGRDGLVEQLDVDAVDAVGDLELTHRSAVRLGERNRFWSG